MNTIEVESRKREEFIDITCRLQNIVAESNVCNGLCIIFCPHTTAGLTINENADPDVVEDILAQLNKLIPRNAGFKHSEGNSDAHIKASLMGPSLTVLIEGGKLILGAWQGTYLCEFDGPKKRKVHIKIL
jgi:secondary thiamine-phosphate synthase enzyme